jgi:hypothetical protein
MNSTLCNTLPLTLRSSKMCLLFTCCDWAAWPSIKKRLRESLIQWNVTKVLSPRRISYLHSLFFIITHVTFEKLNPLNSVVVTPSGRCLFMCLSICIACLFILCLCVCNFFLRLFSLLRKYYSHCMINTEGMLVNWLIHSFIQSFTHLFCSLSYNRSIPSSKVNSL